MRFNFFKSLLILSFLASTFISCTKNGNEFEAYFGGEIINPNNSYVLFCKDNEVIDSILLDKDNRFIVKFDSLAPGLYTFKHEPEYQYVFFDKNDSIMVRVNTRDFDNSIAYCGRGDTKNNFLIDLYLKHEKELNNIFSAFEYDLNKFTAVIDKSQKSIIEFYNKKKSQINWSPEFDTIAKAAVDFNYYSKKELYPRIHQIRTGNDVYENLPKDYYDFRKNIDFNSESLSSFYPYVSYLSHMLNNIGSINYHNHYTEADLALKTNINKLNIADTLINNEKLKNVILNNIAFTYLLEDQNINFNHEFLKTYNKYSTDKSQKNEINKIGNAIQKLKTGNNLPVVNLIDNNGNKIASNTLLNKKTVIFFWTSRAKSHMEAVHKKIQNFKLKNPSYQFIGVNLNDSEEQWKKILNQYNFNASIELRAPDFQDIKYKWAINKIHRTIIINQDGTIKNAFSNIFDSNFEDLLK